MKFTKQDLLTMLIGLFLFSSCKDNNTIGLAPDGDAISGDLYDNTTLTTRTQREDAVAASALTRFPIGLMVDPVFGTSEAGVAMTVNIPSVGYRFGNNPIVDSAVLVLPYSTQFYGDSTAKYDFAVKQLTTDMSLETSYLSSKEWFKNTSDVLGTNLDHQQRPTTSFKVTNIVTGKPDTAATVAPQLRIRLNPTLIQNRIVKLDTNIYARNDLFTSKFNGLYVNVTRATGVGAIAFFNFDQITDVNNGAKLQIYYRKDGTSPLTFDTVSVIFPIDKTTSPVSAYVKHTYTADINTQLNDPSATQYPKTYIQGLTGLRNKISFDFSEFKTLTAGSKVSVNKAELVIDLSPEDDVYFKPAPRLRLYRYDAAGLAINLPDNDRAVSGVSAGDPRALPAQELFGGYFDSVNRRYIFSITAYVQDLIDGKKQDYGTFIAPTPSTEFTLSPWAASAERSILLAPVKNAAAGTKRMKLNIFYTKVR
ncbi:DUF4270 domain-containing protein [Pedobacter polysacchareus]|uniref:DUF4270 domain-containing protein n=1 Tax=Pedobacter polysacchareus TaxID=2861973 RepID=UPI001C99B2E4|nr:DUF4270 domain-containing protein [Pedobacter polysacchareus]